MEETELTFGHIVDLTGMHVFQIDEDAAVGGVRAEERVNDRVPRHLEIGFERGTRVRRQ